MICKMLGSFSLFAAMAVTAQGAANTDLGNGFINAAGPGYLAPTISAGTVCDSSTPSSQDASSAINSALADVGTMGGGIVYVPTGVYCIKSHLVVPSSVTLKGASDAPPQRGALSIQDQSTVLLATEGAGSTTGFPFVYMNTASVIEGLTIYYPNQTLPTGSTFFPVVYPYTIRANDNTTIQNIVLWNSYLGVDLSTGSPGRHRIKGLYGQPLLNGIRVDRSLDVGRIDDIHFWPYWSGGNNAAVLNWTRTYGNAFIFGRCDGEYVSNVFTFGYAVGMWFDIGSPNQGACGGTFTNIGFDNAAEGLHIVATAGSGLLFNQLTIAEYPINGIQTGINKIGGSNASVNITQGTFVGPMHQAILWDGGGQIAVRNSNFFSFASGVPAIQLVNAGGSALVQDNAFPGAISGTPAVSIPSGATRSMVTGNSLYGSTIVNASTTFLQANNLP